MTAPASSPTPPWSEIDRLAALERYRILDTPSEADFDDIARIAAQICGVPIALVTLVDESRQWFKAKIGTDVSETPREIAFCAHTILQNEVMVVDDATRDPRFAENPLVTGDVHVRFYAGAPVTTPDGLPLGTLCVLDTEPHMINGEQREALAALARQVMGQFELRRTLAQQRADQRHHRMILESAVDYAIISMDTGGFVTSWNEGARRIFGWSEPEMRGQPCDRFFTPEDRAADVPRQEMAAALADGRGNDERWHERHDRSRFWAAGEMMPLTDDAGRPAGFLKILRDRTEQRLARERLENVERRFQMALGAAGFVGSWDWSIQEDLVYADAHFAAFYSVDPAQAAAGLPLARFIEGIHPDDREWVGERIRRCIADRGEFAEEYRLLGRDGAVRWIFARGRCFEDEAGVPTNLPGVAMEITGRKAIEDALRDSEARTRLALEAAELGAWESTPSLSDMRWDARTCFLLGHDADRPLDFETSFLARVHDDDRARVQAEITEALADGGAGLLDSEYRVRGVDGQMRSINARGRLIHAVNAPSRFVGTVRDISAQREAEEHRRMLANELQHRIKNTLAVVQAIVSQSLRNVATPAEAREAIGDRLATLARAHDLLTQTSWSAAPISAVVEGSLGTIGARQERIHAEGPDIRLQARAALALAMALHELATNAAKYGALSNDEGEVRICWMFGGDADRPTIELVWQEAGGPPVTPPSRRGFGSRLIETSLARDLGGEILLEYLPAGVRWSLIASRDEIQELG